MSSIVKSGPSPPPAAVGKKHHIVQNSGSGPPALTHPTEPLDDVNMNEVVEEKVDLEFIKPSGESCQITVDSSIPMYDLRIQLAASCKVSPSGYTLVVFSDETGKPLEFKANQTVGSLEGRTVQLLLKNSEADKSKKFHKESSKGGRPFEMTHRFTVNLPHNQKMVVRINSSMTLEQLHMKVCQDKNYDPSRYIFQHSSNPQISLSAKNTIADLRCTEINLVPNGMVDSAQSMPDLWQTSVPAYMPATEMRKKRGFLSFLRKDKKLKLQDDIGPSLKHTSSISHTSSTPPSQRISVGQTRPKSMFDGSASDQDGQAENVFSLGKENAVPKQATKATKKRPAPPPPQQKEMLATVEIKVKDGAINSVVEQPAVETSKSEITVQADVNSNSNNTSVKNIRLHSRNSSDSSGYHELTLSGADSPEAHRVTTTFKTSIDATSIESTDDVSRNNLSKSVHILAAGESQTLPLNRPSCKPSRRSHSLERNDKTNKAAIPSSKKKRAPAPPGKVQVTPAATTEQMSFSQKEMEDNKEVNKELPQNTDVDITFHDDDMDVAESGMMMVENMSICSEDIDNIEQAKIRPCSFVAPPPPNEPPPQDMPPVHYSPVMDQHKLPVTTDAETEVNDNASLGPSSAKTSPQSVHSHTNSQTSVCSANSIDEISLSFEQTIAAAEEALACEQQKEVEYKSEMAMFVERMSILTEDADTRNDSNSNVIQSLDDTESNSDTGSVIRHNTSTTSDGLLDGGGSNCHKYSGSESGSTISSVCAQQCSGNSLETSNIFPKPSVESYEVSEIVLTVPVVPPPPEFQNSCEDISGPNQSSKSTSFFSEFQSDLSSLDNPEVEDQESTLADEEIVNFAPQSGYIFGGAYHIPESQMNVSNSTSYQAEEQKLSYRTFDAGLNSNIDFRPNISNEMSPLKKEEFILSLEDLQNISYTAGPYIQSNISPQQFDKDEKECISSLEYAPSHTVEEPLYTDVIVTDNELLHENVRQRCSDLIFPSKAEEEVDSLLEEKSISQIALPAIRTDVTSISNELSDSDGNSEKYTSVKTVTLGQKKSDSSKLNPTPVDRGGTAKESMNSVVSTGEVEEKEEDEEAEDLQKQQIATKAQYVVLQQQFNQWQQQLLQNQKLLASQQIEPDKAQSVQLQQMQMQIQMQQEIMSQLQQSMQALDLQEQQQGTHVSAVKTDNFIKNDPQFKRTNVGESNLLRSRKGPVPPPPPRGSSLIKESETGLKAAHYAKPDSKRFQRLLDPREELMIAIRSFGGRNGLKKVSVEDTHWHGNITEAKTEL